MTIDTKIEILATILKDLILAMDPEDIRYVRRYDMLKDLDRILKDAELERSRLNG